MEVNNKVAIIAGQPTGGTFLDWSIHWLSGSDMFYNSRSGWTPVTKTPLTEKNAHGHEKNHPGGTDEVLATIDQFDQLNTTSLLTFYAYVLNYQRLISKKVIDLNSNMQNQLKDIYDFQKDDFARMWKLCNARRCKIIYIKSNNTLALQQVRFSDHLTKNKALYTSGNESNESREDYLNLFFKDDVAHWKEELNMTHQWDKREFISLNIRPFDNEILKYDELVDFTLPHYYLNAEDLYTDGITILTEILNYLKLPIVKDRLTDWISIYNSWQKTHLNNLRFSSNFNRIIDSIINNHFYDLTPYHLDLWQEATIQHVLIYKHGMTLKAWGLEKFSNNTQELHTLLEPNVYHEVKNIYGVLK